MYGYHERETAINLPWLFFFLPAWINWRIFSSQLERLFLGWVERTTQRHTHIYIHDICTIYICICIYTSNMHTSRYNSSADRNGCPCGFKQRVSVSICFGPLAFGPLLSSHAPIGDHPPQKKGHKEHSLGGWDCSCLYICMSI